MSEEWELTDAELVSLYTHEDKPVSKEYATAIIISTRYIANAAQKKLVECIRTMIVAQDYYSYEGGCKVVSLAQKDWKDLCKEMGI